VYLPLPTGLHAHWGRQALLAGKHVLVEKSLTADLASARELVRLAAERELVLMENFMFVHHAQHRKVRELIDAGTIGDLRVFESQFAIPPRAPDDIRYQPELGGGALLDVGAYTVRAAQLFLGATLTVDGAFLSYGGGVDLSGSALLHDERGVIAALTFGLRHAYRCAYTIWGSAGAIHLDRAFTCPATRQPVVRVERQDHREELTLPADDHFANVVAHFARLCRQRSELSAHHAQLLRQAQLLDEIRNRAAAHQVTRDEVTDVPVGHGMRG
jgi:dTDP-3,4-didehydro-2,6-dideoxy-alpha-D-glucose 3-reductase